MSDLYGYAYIIHTDDKLETIDLREFRTRFPSVSWPLKVDSITAVVDMSEHVVEPEVGVLEPSDDLLNGESLLSPLPPTLHSTESPTTPAKVKSIGECPGAPARIGTKRRHSLDGEARKLKFHKVNAQRMETLDSLENTLASAMEKVALLKKKYQMEAVEDEKEAEQEMIAVIGTAAAASE